MASRILVLRRFYCYILFYPDGTPFYVGKGQGARWEKHWTDSYCVRSKKNAIINKIKASGKEMPKVKVAEGLTSDEALAVERALIAAIGRFPNGPLANQTDGGEGPAGRIQSVEEIAKRVAANTGKKRTPEQIAKFVAARTGVPLTAEHRASISAVQKGKKRSPESIEKFSASMKLYWAGLKESGPVRLRMSDMNIGSKRTVESRAKMSAAQKANGITAEQRAKMVDGIRRLHASGNALPIPDEQRKRMIEATRRYQACVGIKRNAKGQIVSNKPLPDVSQE